MKILKVKISYFRVNLETFCARKVGEHGSDFYQDCSKDWIASKWQNLRILCIWLKISKQNFSRFKHGRVMLLKYDAWNWLNFSQNEKKWYSDNFQEPSKGAQLLLGPTQKIWALYYSLISSTVIPVLVFEQTHPLETCVFCVWTNETSASSQFAQLFSLAKTLQRSGT